MDEDWRSVNDILNIKNIKEVKESHTKKISIHQISFENCNSITYDRAYSIKNEFKFKVKFKFIVKHKHKHQLIGFD